MGPLKTLENYNAPVSQKNIIRLFTSASIPPFLSKVESVAVSCTYHKCVIIDDVHHIFSIRSEMKKMNMKLFDDMIADLVSRSLHSLFRENFFRLEHILTFIWLWRKSKVVYAWTLPSRVNCVSALALEVASHFSSNELT